VLSAAAMSLIRPVGPSAVMVTPDGGISVVAGSSQAVADVTGMHWDALTSGHGVSFWFTVVGNKRNEVNRLATQLLLATSTWTAAEVPLLYGPVLVAGRTPTGKPTALSMAQFEVLNTWSTLSWRARRTLRRRIERERLAGGALTSSRFE
jgi:hypothetical protein